MPLMAEALPHGIALPLCRALGRRLSLHARWDIVAAVMDRCFDWFNQALRALEKANIDLKYDHCRWACFTAQQAVEKAVNGLLMSRGYDNWGHAVAPMHGRD